MSLLDQSEGLYEIKLYYKYIEVRGNKKLVVLEDDKAKELMEDEKQKKSVQVLTTRWANLNWREQNEVSQLATRSGMDGKKEFSYILYRDALVKRCLKQWDITVNEKPVPVTPDSIDALPGDIVSKLYVKFEQILDYTETELKN